MLNRAAFNRKRFDLPEKPTEIDVREGIMETVEASKPELLLTAPAGFTADGAIYGTAAVMLLTYRESLAIPFNIQRLIEILNGSGYPAVYNHYISRPELPFLLFIRDNSSNFFADNAVFLRKNRWIVTLCTDRKSTATERAIERIFDENEICWDVFDEFYNKEDRVYQTIYEFSELEETP